MHLEVILGLGLFPLCRYHNEATLIVVCSSGDNWLEIGEKVVFVYAENSVDHKERGVIENDNTLIFINSNEDIRLEEGFQIVSAEEFAKLAEFETAVCLYLNDWFGSFG